MRFSEQVVAVMPFHVVLDLSHDSFGAIAEDAQMLGDPDHRVV